MVAKYVSKNSAPRDVYAAKLTGSYKRTFISNLFQAVDVFMKLQKILTGR